MKKAVIKIAVLTVLLATVLSFAGCGVKPEKIKKAYTDAGFTTVSSPALIVPAPTATGIETLVFKKDDTTVWVYKFSKAKDADAYMLIAKEFDGVESTKVSQKGKVYVCVTINKVKSIDSVEAMKIFNNLFE